MYAPMVTVAPPPPSACLLLLLLDTKARLLLAHSARMETKGRGKTDRQRGKEGGRKKREGKAADRRGRAKAKTLPTCCCCCCPAAYLGNVKRRRIQREMECGLIGPRTNCALCYLQVYVVEKTNTVEVSPSVQSQGRLSLSPPLSLKPQTTEGACSKNKMPSLPLPCELRVDGGQFGRGTRLFPDNVGR